MIIRNRVGKKIEHRLTMIAMAVEIADYLSQWSYYDPPSTKIIKDHENLPARSLYIRRGEGRSAFYTFHSAELRIIIKPF
jgi:hypothetical protein